MSIDANSLSIPFPPGLTAAVFSAIAGIALTALPGVVAGCCGMLSQDFLQRLARFMVMFMTPSLILSSLGSSLRVEELTRMVPLIWWSFFQVFTGRIVSMLLIRVSSASSSWARLGNRHMVCLAKLMELGTMFQNAGSFNMILMQSLCEQPGLFSESKDVCAQDSILLIFGYAIFWDVAMWTYGYSSLQALGQLQATSQAKSSVDANHISVDKEIPDVGPEEDAQGEEMSDDDETAKLQPVKSAGSGPSEIEEGKVVKTHSMRKRRASEGSLSKGASKYFGEQMASIKHGLSHCCNPVFAAIVLGIIIGLRPSLKQALFSQAGSLSTLGHTVKRIGQPVPMLGLQILGGTLGSAARELYITSGGTLRSQLGAFGTFIRISPIDVPSGQRPAAHMLPFVQVRSWVLTAVFAKLMLLPAIGFTIFIVLTSLTSIARATSQPGPAGPAGPGSADAADAELASVSFANMIAILWPQDKLLRILVLAQWCAPSCLQMIVLCHRVGLEECILHALAMMYLAMYSTTVLTSTAWLIAALMLF